MFISSWMAVHGWQAFGQVYVGGEPYCPSSGTVEVTIYCYHLLILLPVFSLENH